MSAMHPRADVWRRASIEVSGTAISQLQELMLLLPNAAASFEI